MPGPPTQQSRGLSPPPFVRGWQNPPPQESLHIRGSLPPVDVVVQVCGHRFHAHGFVLSAHSGHFRSLLAAEGATLSVERPAPPPSSPSLLSLSLPSLSSSLFALLLDFMYTSRLHLDVDNVADVLLGAQLLGMPRAVDACRGYLLRLQQHFAHQTLGLYPLPVFGAPPPNSDPVHSRFLYPGSQPPPPYGSHRVVRPIPTAFFPPAHLPDPPQGPTSFEAVDFSPSPSLDVAPPPRIWGYGGAGPKASAPPPPPERSLGDLDSTTEDESPGPAPAVSTMAPKMPGADEGAGRADDSNDESGRSATASVRTVVDIACCDGPVKFQRVLNENCSLVIMMTATQEQPPRSGNARERQREASAQGSSGSSHATSISTSVNFHFPTKSGRPATTEVEPVGAYQKPAEGGVPHDAKPDSASSFREAASPASENPNKPSGFLYYCVHCKHSFKSRCCYMKHRWRHLNPMTLVTNQKRGGAGQGSSRRESPATRIASVEAVRVAKTDGDKKPLEINVPFYPCKQCGCKFPSYYFVHKHRKICHEKRRRRQESADDEVTSSSLDVTAGDDVTLTDDNGDDGEVPLSVV